MNNSQVAHVWAQQRKPSGKGSNFFFDGPTIFSYGRHFAIASFTSPGAVLFTTRGYSMSTSIHINYARRALSGLPVLVFNVPEVFASEYAHELNLRDYSERFTVLVEKAARARINGPWYLEQARRLQEECALYCEFFERPAPAFISIEIDGSAINEKARLAREACAADRTAREELRRQKNERKCAEWRAGEILYMSVHDGPTMLRLSADGERVETSRGANVPVSDARMLWRMVRVCVANNSRLDTPPPVAVGEFQLREISADGTCIVGCHVLEYSETLAFAKTQGWANG